MPLAATAAMVLGIAAMPAIASHMGGWSHDHSSAGVPYRPHGYSDLVRVFGQPCSDRANNARTAFPHINARYDSGYVYHHPYLARNIAHNIRGHVEAAHKNGAWDYGQWGYNCRTMRGGSSWSTHAFGAAVDTNSARNPDGQCSWNGRGANGTDFGTYLPDVWRNVSPGHMFRWGQSWCDPMHFQYVTDY